MAASAKIFCKKLFVPRSEDGRGTFSPMSVSLAEVGRGRNMRRLVLVVPVVLFSIFVSAQTAPAKSKPEAAQPSAALKATSQGEMLPIKRVVLYKNGVGYFEHIGRARGNQEFEIKFTTAQLNDVLKSLTLVDYGGGQITGVRYNSIAPLSQRLSTLRVQIGEDTTRAQFLNALRGAKVEVKSGAASATGRLLSVETQTRKIPNSEETIEVTQLSLVSDSGEMRNFDLTPATSVRFLEADLNREVARYLQLIASSRAKDVRQMTITSLGSGERDLMVSYISEVPVWKSTYRLLIPSKAGVKPLLQGWAIVDNTVGEDWKDVQLSLVAGAPQSFIQQISQPLYTRRPTVALPQTAMLTPQTHEGTVEEEKEEAAAPPSPAVVPARIGSGSGGGIGGGAYKVADRDALMNVPGAGLTMYEEMGMASKKDRVAGLPANQFTTAAAASVANVADGGQLGDLFEYAIKQKITVLQNQSALVPIVQARVDAEKVTIWNEGDRTPLRAIWLKNSSGLTLDGGTFNVLEGESFAGEGLFKEMKPEEKRLLSYAADTAVQIRPEIESSSQPYTRIVINKGVMRLTRELREKRLYTLHNSDTSERQVVIEHPVRNGWKLAGDTKPEESSLSYHRFRVPVEGGKTAKLSFEEYYPQETTYVLTSLTDEYFKAIFAGQQPKAELEQAFRRILGKKGEIAGVEQQIRLANQEVERINREQNRLRENMKALKGSTEEKALLQRYVGQLNTQEDRLASLNADITKLDAQRNKLNAELQQIADEITLDEEM